MVFRKSVVISWVICAIVAGIGGVVWSQEAPATAVPDIQQLVPANSLVVIAYDGRPENPTIQVVRKYQDLAQVEKQQAALRKAAEDFATLFGVSLDWAKDISPWVGQQWAFVLVPSEKKTKTVPGSPVFLITSKDQAAADALLVKALEPWERVAELQETSIDGCTVHIVKAKNKKGVELYATACGPVVAFSPSETALKSAVTAKGFAPDSPGKRVFKALSGSAFYLFVNPAVVKAMGDKEMQIPVDGVGMGVSAVDTGVALRAVGFPSEQALTLLNQLFPVTEAGTIAANSGVPRPSLVVAALPNLSSVASFASLMSGSRKPELNIISALGDTQISGAVTAVLPSPAALVSIEAPSESAAADKSTLISELIKGAKIPTAPAKDYRGLWIHPVKVPNKMWIAWTQVGRYLLASNDKQTLFAAAQAVKDQQFAMVKDETYTQTMAGLAGSNLQTTYINLAPLQGLGYLMEGLGFNMLSPLHAALVSDVEDVKALGIGVGFDGQAVQLTMFLRTKPGVAASIAPAVAMGAAVGAAVGFPVLARARLRAINAECVSKMKQLALAARMYAEDHSGRLPSRLDWQKELQPYVKIPISEMKCKRPGAEPTIFAFNKNLGGLSIKRITNAAEVVVFFEASPGLPNASGSRANVAMTSAGAVFAYMDGHVETECETPAQSHWVPKYSYPKAPATKGK